MQVFSTQLINELESYFSGTVNKTDWNIYLLLELTLYYRTTWSFPSVNVPVILKATVLIWETFSRWLLRLIRIPFLAELFTPLIIGMEVAIIIEHGHATRLLKTFLSIRPYLCRTLYPKIHKNWYLLTIQKYLLQISIFTLFKPSKKLQP